MKNRMALWGGLVVMVCGLAGKVLLARRAEGAGSGTKPLYSLSSANQNSKQWQKAAKTFNTQKAGAATFFAGATKVEAFRLAPVHGEKAEGMIDNFTYYTHTTVAGKDFAARLGAIVLDANSYVYPGQSTTLCYFSPGVAFRIWKGTQFVDTIICFHCDQLVVAENNSKLPERSFGGSFQGRYTVAGDFKPVTQPLLNLSKEAFPNDPIIPAF